MKNTQALAGTIMTAAAAAGFGLMGIFAQLAYAQGMTVGTLLAYRFLIAAALFWLWIAATRRMYRLTWGERGMLWGMGIGGYAALALGSAAVYSVFIVCSNRLLKHVSPLASSAHISSSAAIALIAVALAQGTLAPVTGLASWGAVLGVAVLSTFVAILAFFEGVKRIGSTRASMVSTLEPVVTIASSAAVFHERLSPLQWLGIAIVLASLIAMELRGSGRQAAPSRTASTQHLSSKQEGYIRNR